MERKKAADFPQELLNLLDRYVHGEMSRREFFDGAHNFAVAGVSAAARFEMQRSAAQSIPLQKCYARSPAFVSSTAAADRMVRPLIVGLWSTVVETSLRAASRSL